MASSIVASRLTLGRQPIRPAPRALKELSISLPFSAISAPLRETSSVQFIARAEIAETKPKPAGSLLFFWQGFRNLLIIKIIFFRNIIRKTTWL